MHIEFNNRSPQTPPLYTYLHYGGCHRPFFINYYSLLTIVILKMLTFTCIIVGPTWFRSPFLYRKQIFWQIHFTKLDSFIHFPGNLSFQNIWWLNIYCSSFDFRWVSGSSLFVFILSLYYVSSSSLHLHTWDEFGNLHVRETSITKLDIYYWAHFLTGCNNSTLRNGIMHLISLLCLITYTIYCG